MDYRTLGRSGCAVSTLALGTMTFGAETDEAGAHAQLDAFVEAGGTLIDTADVYSRGTSEEIVGRWLAQTGAGGGAATQGGAHTGAAPHDGRGRGARHQGARPHGRRSQRRRAVAASPARCPRRVAAAARRRVRA